MRLFNGRDLFFCNSSPQDAENMEKINDREKVLISFLSISPFFPFLLFTFFSATFGLDLLSIEFPLDLANVMLMMRPITSSAKVKGVIYRIFSTIYNYCGIVSVYLGLIRK